MPNNEISKLSTEVFKSQKHINKNMASNEISWQVEKHDNNPWTARMWSVSVTICRNYQQMVCPPKTMPTRSAMTVMQIPIVGSHFTSPKNGIRASPILIPALCGAYLHLPGHQWTARWLWSCCCPHLNSCVAQLQQRGHQIGLCSHQLESL